MSEEEKPEIDWGSLLSSQISLAEMVWNYFVALENAGFSTEQALLIAQSYQTLMLSAAGGK